MMHVPNDANVPVASILALLLDPCFLCTALLCIAVARDYSTSMGAFFEVGAGSPILSMLIRMPYCCYGPRRKSSAYLESASS
ncbi:hypothetical protein EDD85DRAFT_146547 [Armillaria nabsnona]|nr:hypothetical protein EDD85DRAFT_146547 [Armillaria nabsnona]